MKKREYKIRNLSWTEFVRRKEESKIIIIPTGAVEIYGPHLPMGSDGIVTDFLSELLAPRINALIAPRLDLSDSSMLLDLPGTFSVTKEFFTEWIEQLMKQLSDYGFEKFLFLTGHAAGVDPINYVARRYQREKGIQYAQVDWWRFAAALGQDVFEEKGRMAHGHASECGTSVLSYIAPELVEFSKAVREEPDNKYYRYPEIIRFTPMNLKSTTAVVGDATKGNPEKGRKIIEKCCDYILAFLKDEWQLKIY